MGSDTRTIEEAAVGAEAVPTSPDQPMLTTEADQTEERG
jgi:hypothetical protein